MTTKVQTLVNAAQAILDRADHEGRPLSAAEITTVRDLTDQATLAKSIETLGQQLGGAIEGADGGLYAAMHAQGYDRISNPAVTVPFALFGATASFDGDYKDAVRYDVTSPPLGSDSRFLFPSLQTQGVIRTARRSRRSGRRPGRSRRCRT
jgi:hypothetical protein